jgi:hypothetical protein
MEVQPLHLVWRKCHCLIQEDKINGSITVTFVLDEMTLLNSTRLSNGSIKILSDVEEMPLPTFGMLSYSDITISWCERNASA